MACVTACPSGVQYDTPDRADPGPGRAATTTAPPKDKALRGADLLAVPAPAGGCGCCAARCALLQATGLDRRDAPHRPARADGARSWPRWRASRRGSARPEPLPERHPRHRASAAPSSACSPAACRARSSRASTPPPRGCSRPRAATSSCPRQQGCCGALSVHNGREEEAQGYARRLVDTFEAAGVEYVVVNAAGCGSTMKEYAELLADDPAYADRARAFAEKVRDVSEILDELGPVAPRHPLEMTIAYHDACHLAHAQGVRAQPRAAARRRSPAWSCREIAEPELCCGSAGHLQHPQPRARPRARRPQGRQHRRDRRRRCSSPPTPAA